MASSRASGYAVAMRAAFRLLVMACLVWCAMGVAEPVQAHGGAAVEHADAFSPAQSDPADAAGEAHHHHCPVAPDLPVARLSDPAVAAGDPPVAPRAVALASLTRAPPLPPPSA
ncbi:hypothetical protein [Sphingomonas corticis]|jgi:hypothetical protein|uniref:DUF2946 domain-containing protein n=1 Tax=Sphingomonas corticis TaxID=2722791 RepID=A0ABX1CVW9_9SPHN|nr:hypothetical protein [Sphingomonas corticis]NJR80120.1 hypothetical protein [Sphingomonas corticis]